MANLPTLAPGMIVGAERSCYGAKSSGSTHSGPYGLKLRRAIFRSCRSLPDEGTKLGMPLLPRPVYPRIVSYPWSSFARPSKRAGGVGSVVSPQTMH